jgi:SAM-dependent methyltransferase
VIFGVFFTIRNYIIKSRPDPDGPARGHIPMFKWFRPSALDPLAVSMAGAKLGDRVLVVGCSDPRLIAALAAKAGLSGRACAVDESEDLAAEAGRFALKEGALIETSTAPLYELGFDGGSFDLVVLRNVGTENRQSRAPVVHEAWRLLRPGGRCMIIDTLPGGGMAAIFGGQARPSQEGAAEAIDVLKGQGFVAVRTLAEREGLRFVEAVKKNS